MPTWESTELLDKDFTFSDITGGGATFDDDGDLQILDTSVTPFFGTFRNRITDYAWLEFEFQNLDASSDLFFQFNLFLDIEAAKSLSTSIGPRIVRTVNLNAFGIKTVKVPYFGPIEGIGIEAVAFPSGVKIRSIKAIRRNSKGIVSQPATLVHNALALGYVAIGNNQYQRTIPLGVTDNFSIAFVSQVGHYLHIKVEASLQGLEQCGGFFEGALATGFGVKLAEFFVDSMIAVSPFAFSPTAHATGDQAVVTVTIEDFSLSSTLNAWGAAANGGSPLAPVPLSQINLLSTDNIWAGHNDFQGPVSLSGNGYIKANGFGFALTYSATIPLADISGVGSAAAHDISEFMLGGNNLTELTNPATARTNLGLGSSAVLAATAVAQTANNLSDLANAATARTNLGLGSAAVLASTAILLVANNLSDLNNVVTARTNLGLGSAALLASTAVCQTANNLSDVASAATARTNLGLGSGSTVTFTNLTVTGTITGGSYRENSAVAVAISAGNVTIDCSAGNTFVITLNANITGWTFNNVPTTPYSCLIIFVGDGTTRTVAYPASFSYSTTDTPNTNPTSTLNKEDYISIFTRNTGTSWKAFNLGKSL